MFSKKKNPATYDEKYLVEEINMTKAALSAAYANFDNATDPRPYRLLYISIEF
ncbi:MAG: DUF2508 family protein [Lachnospira pectinoschiza]